ncbi:CU044_5270 family protein [Streptomyces sp. G5(2025)]|uniref:CU044_5270 family protein n=1 Tax=Streptomyces sp. G5(2025) TaxID=3406628 RepID=UPI003C14C9AD
MRDINEAFRSLDPARGSSGTITEEERKAALERVLMMPSQPAAVRMKWLRSRRGVLGGMALVTASAVAVVGHQMLGSSTQLAYAATPPPLQYHESDKPAAEILEALAHRIEKLPDEAPPTGAEHYVQETWSLSTRVNGMTVSSAVIPERTETWKRPDGSEQWITRSRKPLLQTGEQREAWKDAGSPGAEPKETKGSAPPPDKSDPRNQTPPSEAQGMRHWLTVGYGSEGPGATFDSVSEKHLDHKFSPDQRAALLRTLKSVKGIEYRGRVTDRSGREGLAFSVSTTYGGLPKDQTLVFSQSSGKLLAYEEELTEDPGGLKVEIPAVVTYVTYIK